MKLTKRNLRTARHSVELSNGKVFIVVSSGRKPLFRRHASMNAPRLTAGAIVARNSPEVITNIR